MRERASPKGSPKGYPIRELIERVGRYALLIACACAVYYGLVMAVVAFVRWEWLPIGQWEGGFRFLFLIFSALPVTWAVIEAGYRNAASLRAREASDE